MATDNPAPDRSGPFSAFGWVSFVAVVALFLLVSTKAGTRGMGVSIVVGSILHYLSGKGIEYGWEGRPPAGYITGWPAKLITAAFALTGLAIAVWPEVAMGIFGWDRK
jgi:hypothetical protein